MSRGHSTGGHHSSGGFRSGSSFHGSRSHTSINFGLWPLLFMGSRGGSFGISSGSTNPVKYKKIRNHLATLIVAGVFAALCVMFVVFSYFHTFERDYTIVSATASSVNLKYDYDGYYWYTSYDFNFNSEHISTESKLGWSELPDIPESVNVYINSVFINSKLDQAIKEKYLGKQFDIYVKNSNPYIVYEVEGKEDIPSTNAGYIAGAVIMGIITLIVALVGVNKYEVDKEAMAAAAALKSESAQETERRCAYCGAIAGKEDNKCPVCGAPIK